MQFPFFPTSEALIALVNETPFSFFLDSADSHHPRSRYSYFGVETKEVGSLVGYLSYEGDDSWFGCFDPVLVMDHRLETAELVSENLSSAELQVVAQRWTPLLSRKASVPEEKISSAWISQPSFLAYATKLARIRNYLEAGDVYQVNYTEKFEAQTTASAAAIYQKLRKISPAPQGAFINLGSRQIMSASPECFFEMACGKITTFPIKGTCAGNVPPAFSPKERAELLMIVDLERNDLGKICEFGSVTVDKLFEVESFAQVHHLVAQISGKLRSDVTPLAALQALFPGGSITGAPKKRAMEIIAELESGPRGIYTGALGFMGIGGKTQFNIPIRTLVKEGDKITFHAGGGIVIDSDPEKEFEEMWMKVKGIIETLGLNR